MQIEQLHCTSACSSLTLKFFQLSRVVRGNQAKYLKQVVPDMSVRCNYEGEDYHISEFAHVVASLQADLYEEDGRELLERLGFKPVTEFCHAEKTGSNIQLWVVDVKTFLKMAELFWKKYEEEKGFIL